MRRLPVAEIPSEGAAGQLDKESARHAKVLRLREGDELELFDGRGGRARAKLLSGGAYELLERLPPRPSLPTVELILCLPKLPDLESAVKMATELGVTAIHLASSDHSIVKLDERRNEQKLERLRKIAIEASRQSERDELPELHAARALDDLLGAFDDSYDRFIALERAEAGPSERQSKRAALIIGPEGGFSEREARAALDAGWSALSLGPTILRVSTAVAAGLAHMRAMRQEPAEIPAEIKEAAPKPAR